MDTPEGFKKYPKIMLPSGHLVEPASCWLLWVDVFSEREAERDATRTGMALDKVAKFYDGYDLAPVLRKGLKPNQMWLFESKVTVDYDQFVSLLIAAPTEERAWEILKSKLPKTRDNQDPETFICRALDPPPDYEGVIISDFRAG
jgi:hypothetical protein